MILSGQTIRQRVETGSIGVQPPPLEAQYQPASLDLRMGKELLDPATGEVTEDLTLEPWEFRLGHTQDYLKIPNDLGAQVDGRSTVGRKGVIIHTVAGWCDPGFEGQLTLEMLNVSKEPVTFEEGERIGQMIFFKLDTPAPSYDGKYQGQEGPTQPE